MYNPSSLKKIRKQLGFTQSQLAREAGVSQRDVSQTESGVKKNIPEALIQYLNKSGVDVSELFALENSHFKPPKKKSPVPYFTDIPVSAGMMPMQNDYSEANGKVDLPFVDGVDFYASVIGDSMYPKFEAGSVLGFQQVSDRGLILWGQPHLVVTSEYRTLKYLLQGRKEGEVMLRSANDFYQDSFLSMNLIHKLYRVRAAISLFQ
jgi:transcriptional regulator with XRE-family HTH domain